MERPYSGIATHHKTPTGYSIIVPAKKHLPIIFSFYIFLNVHLKAKMLDKYILILIEH